MGKIKFDVSDQDADKNGSIQIFELPPVGVYPAKIVSAVAEEPVGKNPRVVVKVAITKPAKNNYGQIVDYVTMTESSKWKLDQLLLATGFATKTKRKGEVDDKALVGKTIQVYITHETSSYTPEGATEPVTRTKPRITNYLHKSVNADGLKPTVSEASDGVDTEDKTSTEEEVDLDALGESADAEDAEAIDTLTELAAEADLDPNDFDTWAELATAIQEADGAEEAEESEEEEAEEESEDEPDLDALAESADGDDEPAQEALTLLAEPLGLEPDDYETWADLAIAIAEKQGGEGEEEEQERPDLDSMTLLALKKLAKELDIPPSGTKEELVERLTEFYDTDPFKA